MPFVIDASVTLGWYFPDEATDASNTLRERLAEEIIHVPAHWALEVSNGLLSALRRKRLTTREFRALLSDLHALPKSVDAHTDQMAWTATATLAEKHRLTTYDAAYLELAIRAALPLATLDADLAKAAKAEKVLLLA